jgi:DNA-binding NarL/FixJ family response regulator
MTLKIMLVDDHAMFRDGLRYMFENIVNAEVIAEATDGRMAVNHANKIKPDIVIMDIAMKDLNGIEATRQIVTQNPDTKVIALSMHSDSRFVRNLEADRCTVMQNKPVIMRKGGQTP